jgi:two-component system CheB/CheR fusion protein
MKDQLKITVDIENQLSELKMENNNAKDGILILDAETGKIIDVNPFLIDLLGYSKEQFVEKAIWEIGFFKDVVANFDKFIELQQNEYVRYEDLPLETADQRKINVEFVSNVYREGDHNVIQCNILRDSDKAANHLPEIMKEPVWGYLLRRHMWNCLVAKSG